MKTRLLLTIFLIALLTVNATAQFKNYKIKGGVKYDYLYPLSDVEAAYSFLARGYLAFELSPTLALEVDAGWGQYKTEDNVNPNPTGVEQLSETDIIPIDLRLRVSPWAKTAKDWNPYFYIGGGVINYNVKKVPDTTLSGQYDTLYEGWAGQFPVGIGTEIRLSKNWMLDLNGGFTYTTTDLLNNYVIPDLQDSWVNIGLGVTLAGGDDCNTDADKDGLYKCNEETIGTNPDIADTDADGLNDGAEVNQYLTNPLDKDTDDDTLLDGEEVMKYNTDPLKKDTDTDKLNDNEELLKYSTLPRDSDTDDDGLIDGDEVLTHRTKPKVIDTDVGSVGDGIEVNRGTNPLDPNDDVPIKEEPMKVDAVIILEGINFATSSYAITGGSDAILEKSYNTLKNNPEIEVLISGHTDNTGNRNFNMRLSKNRAEAVKEWLVAKGISPARIQTEGFGPDNPIASNSTKEGRYQNRRIEFKRIK